ncbi:putative lipoprotein [Melioribacter roseus P3M-2]|uniref:Putative lipoprotein n=1 Tax=Melioribacter roseus (strain DSM 23840 / JCM 17771 / VKM B-2668 / P3M-2) TaxID=1191523 RepID=I7A259_MELRP|nr:SusE domain-containing protein [Melioribacter roseus]AFN74001.1 putative lipoprotein [Melioribacter roseus P3M-2]
MKRITLTTILMALVGLLMISCERDITEPTISSNPAGPELANLSLNVPFNVNNADSLVRFSWSEADFGFKASIAYTVQLSPKSDFSENVANLITTQQLSGSATVDAINTLILSWNYSIGENVTVYYRVAATVSPYVETVYSEVKSAAFVPYDAVINYPMIYVPGSYQGWSPGAENGRLFSYGFNSVYQGIIRLKDGDNPTTEFKVTLSPNWNGPNYGGTLTQSGDNYSGVLDPNGGNYVVNAGTYSFNVDVDALTISLTKTDDWGIIGSAVPPYDWSQDVDMFYNGQRKVWEITADFNAGEFKFRANDDWALNYGDTGGDGTLDAGGDNIPLPEAGNYTIRFDPVKLTYTIKKN